jgi:hypothetical protein
MNSLLNNIIKHFNKGKDLGDPNLKQGQRFGYMQNRIISNTVDKLPLIEQTTGNGLGSIIEPLTGKKDSTDETLLQKLDNTELQKLGELETEYENLIYKLQALNKYASNPYTYDTDSEAYGNTDIKKFFISEKGKPCPSGYSVLKNQITCNTFLSNLKENPGQHKGADVGELNSYQLDDNYAASSLQGGDQTFSLPVGCSILEATPDTSPGAGSSCTESYGAPKPRWEMLTFGIGDNPCKKRAPDCLDGKCQGNSTAKLTKWPQFNAWPSKLTSSPNSHLICVEKLNEEIFDNIKKVNKEINVSIDKLTKQTKHTSEVHKKEQVKLGNSRTNFSNNLDILIKKKDELDSLLQGYNTAEGQLQDRRQEMNSEYIDYIAWFICAITIGGVVLYKLPSRS